MSPKAASAMLAAGDEPGDAGFDVDLPFFFVDQVVVGAEEGAVVGAGGSAV
jgi:hypothetical protein